MSQHKHTGGINSVGGQNGRRKGKRRLLLDVHGRQKVCLLQEMGRAVVEWSKGGETNKI